MRQKLQGPRRHPQPPAPTNECAPGKSTDDRAANLRGMSGYRVGSKGLGVWLGSDWGNWGFVGKRVFGGRFGAARQLWGRTGRSPSPIGVGHGGGDGPRVSWIGPGGLIAIGPSVPA